MESVFHVVEPVFKDEEPVFLGVEQEMLLVIAAFSSDDGCFSFEGLRWFLWNRKTRDLCHFSGKTTKNLIIIWLK